MPRRATNTKVSKRVKPSAAPRPALTRARPSLRGAADNGRAGAAISKTESGGSLVQKVMQAVTTYMRDNELRVGDTLPGESYFAEQLNVSRAVMREAYGALAALRIIDVGNGRKPRVSALDGWVMAASLSHGISTAQISAPEVWEVREHIEIGTAKLAAALRTEAEAFEILSLVDSLAENCEDIDSAATADIAIHQAIARASHNALYIQIVRAFEPLMQVATRVAWRTTTTSAQRRTIVNNHYAVAKAIANRDVDAAAKAMDRHFDTAVGEALEQFRRIDLFSAASMPVATASRKTSA